MTIKPDASQTTRWRRFWMHYRGHRSIHVGWLTSLRMAWRLAWLMNDQPKHDKTTLPFTGLEVAAATAFLGAMGDRHYSDFGKGAGCGLLLRCIQAAIGAADAYRQREAAEFETSANLDEARRRQAMWDEVDWP